MKVSILFEFKDVSGGGNQFLKALKGYLQKRGVYSDQIDTADVILINSYQYKKDILRAKTKYPHKIFIHRIDGPIRLYNNMKDERDYFTNILNEYIADGTVFQSEWSRQQNYNMGIKKNKFETTVINAPDPNIFNINGKINFSDDRKVRLIATSWSKNLNKGFEGYKWLDDNLDFSKYEMTFVGNSPIKFDNIKMISPVSSNSLARKLKRHDIFITASKNDPCSNSLIEALHCGLPAVGLNQGGHPEIIKQGGELFDSINEIPNILKKITNSYSGYQRNITLPGLNSIGDLYFKFIREVYENRRSGFYSPKEVNIFKRTVILLMFYFFKVKGRLTR